MNYKRWQTWDLFIVFWLLVREIVGDLKGEVFILTLWLHDCFGLFAYYLAEINFQIKRKTFL